METKIRKQIYLDPRQDEYLKMTSSRLGISEAEIIRQALESQIRRVSVSGHRSSTWEQERSFLQSLIELGPYPGKRSWKREDLYER